MGNEKRHRQLELYWKMFLNSADEEVRDEAFSSLYFLSVDGLMGYGRGMGFGPQTCEDAVHDVFCLIYMKRRRLAGVTDFNAYLFRSFRNAMLNVHKKAAKLSDREVGQLPFTTEVTVLDTMIGDEQRREVAATIAGLMAMLTDRQREAVYLRYMHGMDYEEIAALMGLQVGSVRKLVYRAIMVLRKKGGQLRNPLFSMLAAWWGATC
ncbi:sigma-70 family RNA polymerase sigma factor [Prevotella sp. A2931]|uniref:Sigma-70 family RNA polymerase sigma factor n=1 Tax=Prevotella illustrans TaxID=2800387 RepID=A0ABS3M258_9BACT|nr:MULTISPECIES: sigma-70 family RNA polymerase sigma factor [Prevotella]MBO1362280.1 sigma-70 family RNA polymerase sigma factor [Prevotella illustrans]PTL26466.1 sigma-70 family RNA polymerase sigma factor [Prevotella sp. oral taxon 820]